VADKPVEEERATSEVPRANPQANQREMCRISR